MTDASRTRCSKKSRRLAYMGACFLIASVAASCGGMEPVDEDRPGTHTSALKPLPCIFPWCEVIDCKTGGNGSCQECGAGDDGVICCFAWACKVINKPKPIVVPGRQLPPRLPTGRR